MDADCSYNNSVYNNKTQKNVRQYALIDAQSQSRCQRNNQSRGDNDRRKPVPPRKDAVVAAVVVIVVAVTV